MFGMIMGPIMLPLPAKGEHGRQDAEINGQHIAWYPCTTGWITVVRADDNIYAGAAYEIILQVESPPVDRDGVKALLSAYNSGLLDGRRKGRAELKSEFMKLMVDR